MRSINFLLALTIFFIISACCDDTPTKPVISKNKNIKEMREYIKNCETGEKELLFLYKYNIKGDIIEKQMTYDYSKIIEKYEYDEKGKKISGIWQGIGLEAGCGIFQYKYDNNNNLIEETKLDSLGKIKYKKTFKYDVKNNKIQDITFNEDGEENYKNIYSYDENNNLIEQIYYTTGEALCIIKFKYNSNGKLIEQIYHDAKNYRINCISNYKYDKNGNLVEIYDTNSDGNFLSLLINTYNGYGEKIEQIRYHKNGKKTCKSWEYTYFL